MGTLSRVLVDRTQFDEAEQICKDLLVVVERKYGAMDKRTIEALVTLSQLADLRCDSDAAAKFLGRVVAGLTALFGSDAPQTLNVKTDMAGFLAELENFDEAEALFREAAEKLSAQLGPTHEWTIKATTGLAVLVKLRSTLGESHVPGKFASQDVVAASTTSTASLAGKLPTSPVATTTPAASSSSVSGVNGLAVAAAAATTAPTAAAAGGLAELRDVRLEGIKNKPAARKHLRGWLEKLPVELSPRERERLQREKRLSKIADAPQPGMGKSRSAMLGGLRKGISSMLGAPGSSGGGGGGGSKTLDMPAKQRAASLDPRIDDRSLANHNWERRYVQVQSNQKASSLVYWATEDDCRNGREKRGDFVLDDLNSRIFETSQFGPTAFSVTGPKGRLHLRAQTVAEKQQWIEVFKSALAFRGAGEKAKLFEKQLDGGAKVVASTLPPDLPGLGGSAIFAVSDRGSVLEATEKFGSFVNFADLTRQHSSLIGDPDKDVIT